MRSSVCLVAALLASSPHLATAQSPPSICKDIEADLNEGYDLLTRNQPKDALARFRQVQARCPESRVEAQIGLTLAVLQDWVGAHEHVSASLAKETDPWVRENRAALEKALVEIDAHLARVAVTGGELGAEVFVDGRSVARLPLEQPLLVASGAHELEFRGVMARLRRQVTAVARETVAITLPVPQPSTEGGYFADGRHRAGIGLLVTGGLLIAAGGAAHAFYAPQVQHYNYECVGVKRPELSGDSKP